MLDPPLEQPTIFRATSQWFASVDGFRDAALTAIDNVQWQPEVGRNRITAMTQSRSDWCISRQRTWGVPIPVFYHKDTAEVLLDADTLAHAKNLIEEHGADIWWTSTEAEVHSRHLNGVPLPPRSGGAALLPRALPAAAPTSSFQMIRRAT